MPRIPTTRITLYAERGGAGAPCLWISGTGQDLRQPPLLLETPLARAFDLMVYDQRGLGRSDKPDAPASMADYADDAAALMDAVGWARAHVIGYSFGGMVAQHLAIRHPDRVDRLVLGATSPGGEGGASYPLQTLYALPLEERIRRQLLLDARMDEARLANPSPALLAQMEMMRAADAQRAADPEGASGLARQLEARAGHNAWPLLHTIRAPTLVCAGVFDRIAAPDNARKLAAHIPHATLRFYRAGHGFLVEKPEFLDDAIAFLKGADVSARSEESARHG